jgi:hypothetical protein
VTGSCESGINVRVPKNTGSYLVTEQLVSSLVVLTSIELVTL